MEREYHLYRRCCWSFWRLWLTPKSLRAGKQAEGPTGMSSLQAQFFRGGSGVIERQTDTPPRKRHGYLLAPLPTSSFQTFQVNARLEQKEEGQEDCGARITPRGSLSHCCCCLVDKSCPTLCDPTHCGPPGSCVRGIPQARILERFAIFFSRGTFPIQESNLHLLHWQVDSLPLNHQGSARDT